MNTKRRSEVSFKWSLVMAVSKASSWYPAGLKRFVMEFQPDSCSCPCHTFPGFILAQRRWTIWLPSRHLIFRRSEDELLAKTTPWLHDLDKSCCECLNVMIFCDLASRKNIKSVCSSCIDVDLIVWGRSEGMQILDARWRYLDSSCLGWELRNAEHWPPGMDFATPFVNKYHRRGRVVQALCFVLLCSLSDHCWHRKMAPLPQFCGHLRCWEMLEKHNGKSGIGDCGLHGICHVTFCNFAMSRHFGLAEPV